jgi:CheY-like chemotaxis protein
MSRILVADDNADICLAMTCLLRNLGYDVECACDGEAALAAVRSRPPDLVILDVMMPKLDGLDVLARIKGDAAAAAVPVVMFSARHDPEVKQIALERGAADFWLKAAFDFSELGRRTAALVALRH